MNFEWVKSAAEQAKGRYETAVESYKPILDKPIDTQVSHFVCDQTFNCYKELNSWSDIAKFGLTNLKENGMRHSFNTVNLDFAKALAETEPTETFSRLASWGEDDSMQSWSCYELIRKTESNLYNVALRASSTISSIHNTLEVNNQCFSYNFYNSYVFFVC